MSAAVRGVENNKTNRRFQVCLKLSSTQVSKNHISYCTCAVQERRLLCEVNLRTHLSCLFLDAKALCSSSIIQLGGIGGCIMLPRCGDPEGFARGPRRGRVIEAMLSVALGRGSLGR